MKKIDTVERHLFFEGILLKYGYDFRQYAEASLNRRLGSLLDKYQTESLLDVLQKALDSAETFRKILPILTINTTEFFRDPVFFKTLRSEVFPTLKTYPKLCFWIAGCSTGEEVISLAISLKEEGLLSRSSIYATDINPDVLKVAREGIYESSCIQLFNKNYTLAGGTQSPSDYYTAEYGLVQFDRKLLENVIYTEHNLATDAVFVEAHLILCRNVLIYFSRQLQNRAFDIFARSLIFKGFLGIGSKESVRFTTASPYFEALSPHEQKIYFLKSKSLVPNTFTTADSEDLQ
jgi:chemotaxis protein methyltransferase CheR